MRSQNFRLLTAAMAMSLLAGASFGQANRHSQPTHTSPPSRGSGSRSVGSSNAGRSSGRDSGAGWSGRSSGRSTTIGSYGGRGSAGGSYPVRQTQPGGYAGRQPQGWSYSNRQPQGSYSGRWSQSRTYPSQPVQTGGFGGRPSQGGSYPSRSTQGGTYGSRSGSVRMQSPGQSQSVSDRARQYAAPRRNGSGANWNRAGGGAGNYNLNGQNHGGNIIIDRIPDLHRNMDHRGFDGGRGDLMWNGYRVGYHHYDGGWRDNDFFFGFYAYQPWDSCVVSPWYWYPFLPPYINRSHVIILHDDSVSQQWYGDVYDYSYNGGDRIGLDDAVNDIVDSFERDDQRAMDRVVPHSGRIAIYVDGQYSYSMTADDFYNMFKDNVENSKTNRYRIVDVRYDHRDTAKVVAEHDYTDPWGQEATTYNTYYLVRGAEGWVIRDFGTGNVRD